MKYLLYTVVPQYCEAFGSYLVEYFDDAMIDQDASELKGLPVNSRFFVHRVGVVSFFDELLCERAFKLKPSQVFDRLQSKVEYLKLLNGGVYLVGSSRVLSLDAANALCRELKDALVLER